MYIVQSFGVFLFSSFSALIYINLPLFFIFISSSPYSLHYIPFCFFLSFLLVANSFCFIYLPPFLSPPLRPHFHLLILSPLPPFCLLYLLLLPPPLLTFSSLHVLTFPTSSSLSFLPPPSPAILHLLVYVLLM